jgi:hypothetical protein
MRFKTQRGSEYIVDDGTKTFWRVGRTEASGHIRGGDAPICFNHRSDVMVGFGVSFFCAPLTEGADSRLVYTADVTEVIE